MQRIIDGKRYDTKTAKLVHDWDNGHYTSDFHYYDEELYRTKKGAWFLLRSGGALSCMAVSVGNMTGGGSEIEPITEGEAFDWLQRRNGPVDEYFADRIEDA